jgi:hypothetical protein
MPPLAGETHTVHLLKRAGIIALALVGAIALAVAVQWFMYRNTSAIIPNGSNTQTGVNQLTEEQKISILDQLAATTSTSTSQGTVKQRTSILYKLQGTNTTAPTMSDTDKMKLLDSLSKPSTQTTN